jgi:hypothetical protein
MIGSDGFLSLLKQSQRPKHHIHFVPIAFSFSQISKSPGHEKLIPKSQGLGSFGELALRASILGAQTSLLYSLA